MTKLSFDLRSGRWIASLAIGALCVALTAPSTTAGGPVGCVVTDGMGDIHLPGSFNHNSVTWHFHQISPIAILQCDSFNIASGETVVFDQLHLGSPFILEPVYPKPVGMSSI